MPSHRRFGFDMQLEFSQCLRYVGDAVGITVPITLHSGGETIALLAAIDTGAANCLFERTHGDLLGLDIEAGEPKVFATATGQVETFGHVVSIGAPGVQFESVVYFFANPEIRKNLLGRVGWLDRIRLGLVDYEQTMYLAPYDF